MSLEYHVQSAGDDAMLTQILNVRTKDGWDIDRLMELRRSGNILVVFSKEIKKEVEALGFHTKEEETCEDGGT